MQKNDLRLEGIDTTRSVQDLTNGSPLVALHGAATHAEILDDDFVDGEAEVPSPVLFLREDLQSPDVGMPDHSHFRRRHSMCEIDKHT
jgi:hypothetical protein